MSGVDRRLFLESISKEELLDLRYQAVGRMIELKKSKINIDKDEFRNRRKNILSQIRKISSELRKRGVEI